MTLIVTCRIVCSLLIVFMPVEHLTVYLKVTTRSLCDYASYSEWLMKQNASIRLCGIL